MILAVRSSCVPLAGYIIKPASKVVDKVNAPNLLVLSAAYRTITCGGIAKNNSTPVSTKVVYEIYPPKHKEHERWFCQFIEDVDDKTFLGRWYLANSTTELDKLYPKPKVFRRCTVKRRVL
jgi:hypothetical protein